MEHGTGITPARDLHYAPPKPKVPPFETLPKDAKWPELDISNLQLAYKNISAGAHQLATRKNQQNPPPVALRHEKTWSYARTRLYAVTPESTPYNRQAVPLPQGASLTVLLVKSNAPLSSSLTSANILDITPFTLKNPEQGGTFADLPWWVDMIMKLGISSSTDPSSLFYTLLPVEIMQHPVTATSGVGAPPTSSGPIRFCRWLDAYPSGQRDNQFADKDRDRFQIRIPSVIPNLTKMTIKATDLHGAVINGAFQNKTTDGNYEVDMKQENGGMVSEPILLVSDGDDDVTFNGKGTDNDENDQTLLADFGSKIIVTFPELGNAEATFQAQQPIGTITLDMVYCHPKASGAPPPSGIPANMIPLMERQAQKMREIYRQIGIKVDGFSIALITFSEDWLYEEGDDDPVGNLNGWETDALMALVESSIQPSKRIRVGFVGAHLTNSQTGGQIGGKVKTVGQDPCLVSLDDYASDKFNILAHEAGHASALPHNYLYEPNINHWLMRVGVEPYWSNDSNAAKRFRSVDADYIKSNSSYYVPAQ